MPAAAVLASLNISLLSLLIFFSIQFMGGFLCEIKHVQYFLYFSLIINLYFCSIKYILYVRTYTLLFHNMWLLFFSFFFFLLIRCVLFNLKVKIYVCHCLFFPTLIYIPLFYFLMYLTVLYIRGSVNYFISFLLSFV